MIHWPDDTMVSPMKRLCLLGSTGSIGSSTLDIVRRNPELYHTQALVAGQNVDLLAEQISEFRPEVAVVASEEALGNLTNRLVARACLVRSGRS